MVVITYDNEEMHCSHNSGHRVIDKQTVSEFSMFSEHNQCVYMSIVCWLRVVSGLSV